MTSPPNPPAPAPPAGATSGGGDRATGTRRVIGSVADATRTRQRNRMQFECHYCPAAYPDLKGLIAHFEEKHRREEHIVLELPDWMIREKDETHPVKA